MRVCVRVCVCTRVYVRVCIRGVFCMQLQFKALSSTVREILEFVEEARMKSYESKAALTKEIEVEIRKLYYSYCFFLLSVPILIVLFLFSC